LAYNYSDDTLSPPGQDRGVAVASDGPSPMSPGGPSPVSPAAPAATTPVTSDNPQSASMARFNSCRWQQPAESGIAAFCTHREVKPYAGTTGFDSDAWCPDCQYYKLRRAPKKRSPSDDYTY
jgi:hypothetical protein